jgi:hypothetical protein
MNRIKELKKRLNDKVFMIDKHELNSLKKITKTTEITN